MFTSYGKWSTAMYEKTKPIGHSICGDIGYYKERLSFVKGRVLEAGVGTGRMLIPLLEDGWEVEGIDASSHMLAQCKRHCAQRQLYPVLYERSLERLDVYERYEAIIIPTGSIQLFEAIDLVLERLFNALQKGGRLIFDLEIFRGYEVGERSTEIVPLSATSGILYESVAKSIDWTRQKMTYLLSYEFIEKGIVKEKEYQQFVLYWYSVYEMIVRLEKIGFQNITCSAHYTYLRESDEQTKWVTIEAERSV